MTKTKKTTKADKTKQPTQDEIITKSAKKEITDKSVAKNPNHIIISKEKPKNTNWFVVHTYSGHEHKVTQALQQRVKTMNLSSYILESLIPTQNKIQIKRGQKLNVKEKLFPGYILVKMVLTDDSWLAVRTTQGVTGFVGVGNKPTPLPKNEVANIMKFMKMEAPKYKTAFSIGGAVKIIEGPFADFLGSVESIDNTKGKVKVLVSIFGRETPVELDFLQVQKI